MLSRGVQNPEYDAGDAERDDRLGVSAQFRRMFDYMDWRALSEGTRAWRARGGWIRDSAERSPAPALNCGGATGRRGDQARRGGTMTKNIGPDPGRQRAVQGGRAR